MRHSHNEPRSTVYTHFLCFIFIWPTVWQFSPKIMPRHYFLHAPCAFKTLANEVSKTICLVIGVTLISSVKYYPMPIPLIGWASTRSIHSFSFARALTCGTSVFLKCLCERHVFWPFEKLLLCFACTPVHAYGPLDQLQQI